MTQRAQMLLFVCSAHRLMPLIIKRIRLAFNKMQKKRNLLDKLVVEEIIKADAIHAKLCPNNHFNLFRAANIRHAHKFVTRKHISNND